MGLPSGRAEDVAWGQAQADREQAHGLLEDFREGRPLGSLAPAFHLRGGEVQHATIEDVIIYQHFGIDVPYTTIHNRAFHPVGWAIHATVHRAINNNRRARAEAEAAPQWREVARGPLHLTTLRMTLDAGNELSSWWYNGLARIDLLDGKILLVYEESPAALFHTLFPNMLYVMLHYLAWDEIVETIPF